MRKTIRYAALPALTAASLLVVTGCAGSGNSAAGKGGDAEPVAATAAAPQLAVAAAPAGAGAPSAVAHPSDGGGRQAAKSSLKVAKFDQSTGRAVISPAATAAKPVPPKRKGVAPQPSATEKPEEKNVAVGDVIASAPAPGAPHGVLAKVTQVLGKTDEGTEVNTAPATLDALLGDSEAKGKVPVDPSSVKVVPLLPGVKASWTKPGGIEVGPQGAKVPLGSLRLDVGASIPTPKGSPVTAEASATGFVQLAPEVDFSYDGKGFGHAPGTASLALSGDLSAQWELKGQAAATTQDKPVRLPFAKLHADPVIQVGPVPVVVNLDLTCYLQVDAEGKLSVDVRQDMKGDFKVGGSYTWGKGWSPITKADFNASPVRATASASGKVKATLGAEASLGLYGVVGVSADLAPYLRAEGEATATGATDGTGSVSGKWGAYGGLDLTGALQAQLKIFGTPVFERKIPLDLLHREWKLAGGEGSLSTPKKRAA
ncbi:hypothetical protein FHS39_003773 [Streptomyces olivoverticillatus]|uniref:Lipoprotein n=1 Tax=Streptomyces olivoverticillatus TaxID=66427 RepID=A0A7W7LQV7_9ACTN|nr:hypothetical protein [Streptomyces olivoverticillatus]MBB4894715.1 hypothetical protein [Streptomyces olivoverticillatus]